MSCDIRINIKRLHPDCLQDFLQAIGWSGDLRGIIRIMNELAAVTDRYTICLDVSSEIAPHLGIECATRPHSWQPLLDHLIAKGISSKSKCNAILEWPGQIYPAGRFWQWRGASGPRHVVSGIGNGSRICAGRLSSRSPDRSPWHGSGSACTGRISIYGLG